MHTYVTPGADKLPPPLSSGLRDPLSFRGSRILTAHDPSLTITKKIRLLSIAQMSAGHQQVTGNINSFNNIVNYFAEEDAEGRQILQWLSPLEPQKRHQGVRTDRLNGVGNWVLETSEFRKWRDAEYSTVGQVLFCHGNPGVGKTYVR